jgi:orotate phosphoribosyltransferase
MEVARAAGAIVVGACAIVDRSGGKQGLDVPFHALLPKDVKTYQAEECPLCKQGLPVVKPGSRAVKV